MRKFKLVYDDDTLMPFGKFKGEKLENVPDWYLKTIHKNGSTDKDLIAYIEDNFDDV